jgi:hypothetical protein
VVPVIIIVFVMASSNQAASHDSKIEFSQWIDCQVSLPDNPNFIPDGISLKKKNK